MEQGSNLYDALLSMYVEQIKGDEVGFLIVLEAALVIYEIELLRQEMEDNELMEDDVTDAFNMEDSLEIIKATTANEISLSIMVDHLNRALREMFTGHEAPQLELHL